MNDDQLIAALAAGEDAALRELFTRHAPWLAARLRSALPPPDVEDVLQGTFLAVWKGAGGCQPQGTPRAWIWVIARNQAALLLRRRGPVTTPLDPVGWQQGFQQGLLEAFLEAPALAGPASGQGSGPAPLDAAQQAVEDVLLTAVGSPPLGASGGETAANGKLNAAARGSARRWSSRSRWCCSLPAVPVPASATTVRQSAAIRPPPVRKRGRAGERNTGSRAQPGEHHKSRPGVWGRPPRQTGMRGSRAQPGER